jgi:hypothetical protein
MLSPDYINLTGNDQLNLTKKRLNKVIYENAVKNYDIKRSLENISDITQLENKDALNPFILSKGKEMDNEFNKLEENYNKFRTYLTNFRYAFAYGQVGASKGQRLISISDLTKINTYYGHLEYYINQFKNSVSKILQTPSLLSKSDNKKLDKMYLESNEAYNKYHDFFFTVDTRQRLPDPKNPRGTIRNPNYNKVVSALIFASNISQENIATIQDLIQSVDAMLYDMKTGLKEISGKIYENGLNPLRGEGRKGGNIIVNPLDNIPSKFM